MTYEARAGDVEALRDLSFRVSAGQFVSIIGPSGSGKSTLLKIIGGLLEPSRGRVAIDGRPVHDARMAGRFSFVFQNPVLLPWRTVLDNVRLPLEILERKARDPVELLELVGIGGCEALYPWQLSGGMQQRVALARALTFHPDVLLLDEPFGAVDELTRADLNHELVRVWQETGVTILLVTHSIAEAVFLGDRVVVLSSRPATVQGSLDIAFPRPRELALKDSKEFQDEVRCLRKLLS